MMKLHEEVYETLYNNCDPNKFAFNDTGDGYLCVFWDEYHALTCLDMAIRIREFLESNLPEHNKTLKLSKGGLLPEFNYGFGLHSGASTVYKCTYTKDSKDPKSIQKDFIFGIVANTVARLESFTKNYISYNFLITANYKKNYLNQATDENLKNLFKKESPCYRKLGKVDIKDGKKTGHYIFALNPEFISKFKEYYV
ncbi:Uncharacterised protein [uncultured archaeon]|nr:Uncharacterised protein [uncultured archaeon]